MASAEDARYYHRAKPEWVVKRIIELKALMPTTGCRTIALIFNRQYQDSRQMTVGKTFVSGVIQKHQYAIAIQRKRLKHRILKPSAINRVWGLDLT